MKHWTWFWHSPMSFLVGYDRHGDWVAWHLGLGFFENRPQSPADCDYAGRQIRTLLFGIGGRWWLWLGPFSVRLGGR